MSESYQEKTQAPTPKRRRDALQKGQVPRSQEVTTAILLLAGAGALAGFGPPAASGLVALFGTSVASVTVVPVGPEAAAEHIGGVAQEALAAMAPLLLTLACTALLVSALQARGVFTFHPLKPEWGRMNPLKRAGEIWGWNAVAQFVKSLFKLAVVAGAVAFVLRDAGGELNALQQTSPFALLAMLEDYAVGLLVAAGLSFLVLAAADYAFQVWRHEKKLRMTREEVKQELKDSEGDQIVKVRRRTMARQLARRRMMLAVSEADVVVTNPTHIAVALKYDPDVAPAPIVLAMGERKLAQRIKELARQADVPLIENKPLARALLATARVGEPIPVELFVAVAEILAYVYRVRSGVAAYGGRA